jgi:hypothetical protein
VLRGVFGHKKDECHRKGPHEELTQFVGFSSLTSLGLLNKKDELDGSRIAYEEHTYRVHIKFWFDKLKGREYLTDLGVDERRILK